ncbi:MAG TPA: hypothetical protein VM187_07790, partial [Niastella sp.]|nr:hypothetical protein [Niastella sp.]
EKNRKNSGLVKQTTMIYPVCFKLLLHICLAIWGFEKVDGSKKRTAYDPNINRWKPACAVDPD